MKFIRLFSTPATCWLVASLSVLVLIISTSCAGDQKAQSHLLSPKEAHAKIQNTARLQIVDVRTPEEFQAGHIAGAQLINWYENNFNQAVAQLAKDQPVLVYCAVGGRSGQAYDRLKSLGFKEVYDLKGGFDAWRKEGLTVSK